MQTLSKVELAFLAIIGYPELTSKALKLCADKVILFDRNSYPHVSMMWSAYLNTLKRYKKKFGLKVSPDLIAGDLSEAVSNDEDMPEEVVSSCNTILNRLVSGNLPTREELIANGRTVEEIRDMIHATSLEYISTEDLVESVGIPSEDLCMACSCGAYPLEIPNESCCACRRITPAKDD